MSKIYITQFDNDRLRKLLNDKKPHNDYDKALLKELDRAVIVKPREIPDDVITMNSHVRFIDDLGHEWEYWLVYPELADMRKGKVSVLSPIGCALLGYKISDRITVFTPFDGRRDLVVTKIISQPESQGVYNI